MATLLAGLLAAGAVPCREHDPDGGASDDPDGGVPHDAPPAATRVEGRDPAPEAAAPEFAGLRDLAVVHVTSEPSGTEVTLGDGSRCLTPCRLTLPPGRYHLAFAQPESDPVEVDAEVAAREVVRVHVVLGRRTPPEIIVPLYFVGAIFSAGGISSLVLNRDEGPERIDESAGDADSRRFHRNLGAASLVVGVPLLVLATYLLAAGRPGSVSVSAGPAGPEFGIGPAIDGDGEVVGAGVTGSF
jgi:hypothetical protein